MHLTKKTFYDGISGRQYFSHNITMFFIILIIVPTIILLISPNPPFTALINGLNSPCQAR